MCSDPSVSFSEVIDRCGVTNLALSLNKILVSHIQSMLPGLRIRIAAQIDKRSQEMKLYGDTAPADTPMEQFLLTPSSPSISHRSCFRGALLLSMLTEYCQRYAAVLDGRSETIVHDLSGKTSVLDT